MSEGHIHMPNWFRLFTIAIASLYLFSLFMVSQCTISMVDTESVIDSALCIATIVLVIICFALGIFVSLIGLENARRKGKPSMLYIFAIIYFFAGLLATLAYKFL